MFFLRKFFSWKLFLFLFWTCFFRWKGENVSTSEVEAVISNIVDYKDAVVYGVEIRGQEGRAGMVAILDPEEVVDLKEFVQGVKKALPSYARPIFVRILRKIDLTGTLHQINCIKILFNCTMWGCVNVILRTFDYGSNVTFSQSLLGHLISIAK